MMVFAFVKDDGRPMAAPAKALLLSIGGTVVAVLALIALTTSGHALLPTLLMPDNSYTPAMTFLILGVWGLSLSALAVLWFPSPAQHARSLDAGRPGGLVVRGRIELGAERQALRPRLLFRPRLWVDGGRLRAGHAAASRPAPSTRGSPAASIATAPRPSGVPRRPIAPRSTPPRRCAPGERFLLARRHGPVAGRRAYCYGIAPPSGCSAMPRPR